MYLEMDKVLNLVGSLLFIFAFIICFKSFTLCKDILCRCGCIYSNPPTVVSSHTIDVNIAPVVVTSATHTAPGGYPVSQMPPPGGIPANVYAAPYPHGQHNMNIPNMSMHMPPQVPPAGYQHTTPYPPYPPMGVQQAAATMNPPSYEAAVSGVGTGAANAVPYEKQAPYNPNFSGH